MSRIELVPIVSDLAPRAEVGPWWQRLRRGESLHAWEWRYDIPHRFDAIAARLEQLADRAKGLRLRIGASAELPSATAQSAARLSSVLEGIACELRETFCDPRTCQEKRRERQDLFTDPLGKGALYVIALAERERTDWAVFER